MQNVSQESLKQKKYFPHFSQIFTRCMVIPMITTETFVSNYQQTLCYIKLCHNASVLSSDKELYVQRGKETYECTQSPNSQLNRGTEPTDSVSGVPFTTDSWQNLSYGLAFMLYY